MKAWFRNLTATPVWYTFFLKVRPYTGGYFLLFLSLGVLIWYAFYSNSLIQSLRTNANMAARTYADLIRTELDRKSEFESEVTVMERVIGQYDIPVIITNTYWQPLLWSNITVGGIFGRSRILPSEISPRIIDQLDKEIASFRRYYDPRPLYGSDSKTIIAYLVFGNATIIDSLVWMPLIQGFLILAFCVMLYFGIWSIVRTERSNLWVGLAKETAHQLGTPISSLLGWVEYMKSFDDAESDLDPEVFTHQIKQICVDMEKDLTRLMKVTNRFSQIGSVPTLTYADFNVVIDEFVRYFRPRLPMFGKTITIETKLGDIPQIPFNRDLLEWVLENLFKNSIDAIVATEGVITITTEYIESDNIVRIHQSDNGKGISWEEQRNVFSPGFTTKTRGWGLGLTLAKRIIEDYHKGKIYVAWSHKGRGTMFGIDLPAINTAVQLSSKRRQS